MANWSCPQQRTAVLAALNTEQDVCAFLRTGAGKTMLAVIPSLLEGQRVTVVILPLKSLMSDYKRKLVNMGVRFEVYTEQPNNTVSGKYGLVLISADKARWPDWRQTIEKIHMNRTVSRIIFDEAQFALTSDDFRTALKYVCEVRPIGVQLCIMSGTVPPRSEEALLKTFGIVPSSRAIIRMGTDRPELQYILHPPAPSFMALIKEACKTLHKEMERFDEGDRALVYVAYKDDEGETLAKELSCDFYQGGKEVTDEERNAMYYRWINGINKVMVCTNAFGAGNDYPHVRLVLHVGTPKQMVDFIQEVGRGGRDGQVAKCIIMPRKGAKVTVPREPSSDGIDHKGYQEVWDMQYTSTECLRFLITSFIDGVRRGVRCGLTTGSPQCSRCIAGNTR
ncbi:hypothetical protein H0H87_000973 [Tephrocybe sp. NHM501043]|nr:hypothetical protein H0H87_000973 [Tephrocybe sp. NHM501043]